SAIDAPSLHDALAISDDLADTISYVDLADIAVAVVEQERVDLIETLAATIADRIIALGGAHAAEVTVHKPQAPIPHRFSDVRVVARRNLKQQRGREDRDAQQCPLAGGYRPGQQHAR